MQSNSNISSGDGSQLLLNIPTNSDLFRSQTVHDVLSFLSRYHTEEFSISELADAIGYSTPSVSKAVNILTANDLVVDRRDGNSRIVSINPDRLLRPDDPVLQIPQVEFQTPVRVAIEQLRDELDTVIGIVLYGSVARGEADRRSDIDLWVLVDGDRMANQRTANRVRQELEDREFDTGRYAYEIDIESLPAVPNYVNEIQDVLSDGLVVHGTAKFDTVQGMVFHGDLDE